MIQLAFTFDRPTAIDTAPADNRPETCAAAVAPKSLAP
jgi:hypothetical protein